MAWIVDTYNSMSGNELDSLGCVTGKPVPQGGIRGRVSATGKGVAYGIREACNVAADMKRLGLSTGLQDKTVVVQGLGNVGYHSTKFLVDEGATIIAMAEYDGAILNRDGLDVEDVMAHRKEHGSFEGYAKAEHLAHRTDALELECDVLVPAALENQINLENVGRIKAKIIAEAANGPVTADAVEILVNRGVLILPDIYLNAGGVTVSYFEWLKNLSHVRFGRLQKRFVERSNIKILRKLQDLTGRDIEEDEAHYIADGPGEADLVNSGLEDTMVEAYREMLRIRGEHENKIDLRTAAFLSALHKVAYSYELRGIFP